VHVDAAGNLYGAGMLFLLDANANQVFKVDAAGKRTVVAGTGRGEC